MSEIVDFRKREINEKLAKQLKVVIWILTVAVLGLVGLMQRVKLPLPDGVEFTYLPPFHAFLNSLAAIFLVIAIGAIQKGKVRLHQKMIYLAFACSFVAAVLVSLLDTAPSESVRNQLREQK